MGLVLENITKIFRSDGSDMRAVDHIALEIPSGALVTLLGPSGCGKTTTLRMIAGFELPTEGSVRLEGEDITFLPPNQRNISMVFQRYALFPHLSVEENVAFGLKIKHISRDTVRKETREMIDLVGLRGLEKRRPDQLSGGQQQRVALARSLVMKPKVLLFDEPLSNLDAKLRESMRLEIRRIQQETAITSVYVTHDQVEAMSISDLIVIMEKGKIMQKGSPFEVYIRPENAFVADFIGKVNFIEGVADKQDPESGIVVSSSLKKSFNCRNALVEKGRPARIVVRPEAFSLSNARNEELNSIAGTVLSYSFLGSHLEYIVKLPDGSVINALEYNLSERQLPRVGEEKRLFFSKENAWTIPG